MQQFLKQMIKKTPVYYPLRNWKVKRQNLKEFSEWESKGKPLPPPHIIKQRALRAYADKFGLRILVETGTYYGDMVEAMKNYFDRLYSIELSRELYENAKNRFRGEPHIELVYGDSGHQLRNVIHKIDQPTLFWLDGHYSAGETAKGEKETPVYEEIDHIFNAPDMGHVIIVDDARCFGTDPAYPSLEDLFAFIRARRPDTDIAVQDDSIRITPKAMGV